MFSRTTGYRHESIPAGIAAITELGAEHGFAAEATEDAGVFTDTGLAGFAAVVWLSTSGDVLDNGQRAAFRRFVTAGGGYAGVHGAADTEYHWPWYGELVGAYFRSHPPIQPATVHVVDHDHPSTAGLPAVWPRTDEWYCFHANPRPRVRVLATVDESGYDPGPDAMGADHPIAWCHPLGAGRSWYTAGGHTIDSYAEPLFRAHLAGGIRYAARTPESTPVGGNHR